MTAKLTTYVKAGYSLSASERLEAARLLRLSVDQDTTNNFDEVDSAWKSEISSRVENIIAGKVELVNADETYSILSAEIASNRR